MNPFSTTAIERIPIAINNLYVLRSSAGAILIDAGPDFNGSWDLLVASLREHGVDPQDVRYVLITHFHSDHAGLGRRWQIEGASVLAGRGDAWHLRMGADSYPQEVDVLWSYMHENGVPDDLIAEMAERILRAHSFSAEGASLTGEGAGEWYPTPLRMTPVVVDRDLVDRDAVEMDGLRVEAIETPGHTPGSTCFWEPESRTLFTGDHVIAGVFSNPSLYFERNDPRLRLRAMPDYLRSLEKLRSLHGARVCSGHNRGDEDLPGLIDRILLHHRRRTERFARAIGAGRHTLFELAEQNYPRLLRRDLWYVMAEVTGHVDVLEDEGRIVREWDADVWRVRGV